jgi:hypothetical protein
MFKGYEEARVALSALLFTMPCCIIIGIEYGIFMGGKLRKVRAPIRLSGGSCWVATPASVEHAMSFGLFFCHVPPYSTTRCRGPLVLL